MEISKQVLDYDLPKCIKKKWYLGLELELRRIIRLLYIDKALPGQYIMFGFPGDLDGKIAHAGINLPKMRVGRKSGARIIYYFPNNKAGIIKVLYVGGHQDPIYASNRLIPLICERYAKIEEFISVDEYLNS